MSTLAAPPADFVTPPRPTDAVPVWELTRTARQWLLSMTTQMDKAPTVTAHSALTAQSATVNPTALPIGSVVQGVYRVAYHLRITRAATTSSSATVTIGYTDNGVSCTQAGAAATGNTTTTVQSGVFLLTTDGASAITYAVAYASVGATAMQFKLDVTAELVP